MSSITLEAVDRTFQDWRLQRSSRAERIPEKLWSMALSLYPHYKRSHICRRLGLSGSQFKHYLEAKKDTMSDIGFILASTEVDDTSLNTKPSTEIVLGIEGQKRTLTLRISVDELSRVLPQVEVLL